MILYVTAPIARQMALKMGMIYASIPDTDTTAAASAISDPAARAREQR